MPGRAWGPGWVSWAVGGGYVGWCPLGWRDRPVAPWGHYRGYTGGWGRYGRHDPWNVVHQGDLGGRDLFRRRVAAERIEPGVLRVADAVGLRPTRDARSLRADGAGSRAISRRMTPGDFVRELGVDNKTTIPAPWTRGYGPPPAGVDGARYGAQRRTDQGEGDRPSRGWTTNRGTGTAVAPTGGAASGSSRESEDRGASRRAPRPAPWYTPTQPADGRRCRRAEQTGAWSALSRPPGPRRGRAATARAARRGTTERAATGPGPTAAAPAATARAVTAGTAPAVTVRGAAARAPVLAPVHGRTAEPPGPAPTAEARARAGARAADRTHARPAEARAGRAAAATPPRAGVTGPRRAGASRERARLTEPSPGEVSPRFGGPPGGRS